jgi:hypothetical protein
VKLRNAVGAGLLSLCAVAGVASPVYAAQAAQPQAAQPQAAQPQAALKVDKCAVHVNIPHPKAGQTETLTVTSTAGKSSVQVKIFYKTVTHTWNFNTPASTKTTFKFGVGRPTKNYRVNLDGKVTVAPKGYKTGATCTTSFVPQ